MNPRAPTVRAAALGLLAAALFGAAAWTYAQRNMRARFIPLSSDRPAQLSSFVDEAGNSHSIDAYRGKVVVLNLWAAWCVPCIDEMPSLDRLAQRLPEDRFAVVAVDQDRGGAGSARATFDKMALQRLKLYLDPERRLGAEIGARGLPTTLILDADGKPLSFREGAAVWDSDAMVADVRALAPK